MWKPYLNVIAAMLPAALNVLDRFHIAKKLGEAVDEARRQVATAAVWWASGDPYPESRAGGGYG